VIELVSSTAKIKQTSDFNIVPMQTELEARTGRVQYNCQRTGQMDKPDSIAAYSISISSISL